MSVRGSYMTLCMHNNTEVTYKRNKLGILEVTFEEAKYKGFKTAVFDENFNLLSNDGFNGAELGYFDRFLRNNIDTIRMKEEVDNA